MKLPLIFWCLLLAASSASGTVTLQFNNASGSLQNFANSSGVAGAAMVWGIIVDTAGNGFSYAAPGTSYRSQGLTYTSGVPQALNLLVGGSPAGISDDVLFLSPNLMNLQASPADGMPAGTNRVTALASVPLSSGIGAGDAFAVVWLSNTVTPSGAAVTPFTPFGAVNNPGFVIPADGNTTSFTELFTGPDPLKNMTYRFDNFPEPSSALLSLLGAVTLLRRRRCERCELSGSWICRPFRFPCSTPP